MTDRSIHPLDQAIALHQQGRPQDAYKLLLQAREDFPHDPRIVFNLGWYICSQGNWKVGSDHLDLGREIKNFGDPPLGNSQDIWNRQEGALVHLRMEGGFGDQIINFRFIKPLVHDYGCRVIVSCSPGLIKLFARLPEVHAITGDEGARNIHADYWLPAMSAMKFFDFDGKPYLATNPALDEAIPQPLKAITRPKIALRWAGNPKFEQQQFRKFPVELMTSLAEDFPEAQFFSVQRDNDMVDLDGTGILDLSSALLSWEHTASVLKQMDLVITSCTSIAHLAGALGIPTWIVIPVIPYFCWSIPGETTLWYDSARLFRQERFGEWDAPFIQVRKSLAQWLKPARTVPMMDAAE